MLSLTHATKPHLPNFAKLRKPAFVLLKNFQTASNITLSCSKVPCGYIFVNVTVKSATHAPGSLVPCPKSVKLDVSVTIPVTLI